MKKLIRELIRSFGFDIVRYQLQRMGEQLPSDLDDVSRNIIAKVTPSTLTGVSRLVGLIEAVRYIVRNQIPGDIAECGVWRGGSMMAVALTLLSESDTTRRLYLYDTFGGMTQPTDRDLDFRGMAAEQMLKAVPRGTGLWAYASIEDVRSNLASTQYPQDRIQYIQGRVEEPLPKSLPSMLSLLRLDTDWYESTNNELKYMYPLLVCNGVLIIDDYGHWQGAKQATDEYFASIGRKPLLHRLDYTGRLILKTDLEKPRVTP